LTFCIFFPRHRAVGSAIGGVSGGISGFTVGASMTGGIIAVPAGYQGAIVGSILCNISTITAATSN